MVRETQWVEKTFGRFAWRDDPTHRGAVHILGGWEQKNTVSLAPPFELREGKGKPLSVIRCHRLIAPALGRVLEDLLARGLCQCINTFDGCFAPRHMSWDPKRALSRHSWGIAVDVNARLFPYGSKAKQDERLIAAFRRQGFTWGGEWRTPDPMHFEIFDLAAPAQSLTVLVDGAPVAAGFLQDGEAVAPIRRVAEAMGARVVARMDSAEIEIQTQIGGGLR